MSEVVIYVCKMCGRAVKTPEHPNFCYADRADAASALLENISNEQAFMMGLDPKFVNLPDEMFEFPGDVRFDPMTGASLRLEGVTLSEYQDGVLKQCLDRYTRFCTEFGD